jgi:hypothetical protein
MEQQHGRGRSARIPSPRHGRQAPICKRCGAAVSTQRRGDAIRALREWRPYRGQLTSTGSASGTACHEDRRPSAMSDAARRIGERGEALEYLTHDKRAACRYRNAEAVAAYRTTVCARQACVCSARRPIDRRSAGAVPAAVMPSDRVSTRQSSQGALMESRPALAVPIKAALRYSTLALHGMLNTHEAACWGRTRHR